MGTHSSDLPDPSLYIDRLTDENAMHREAAAWSLGEMGSPRAARPLAGLLLRELASMERTGYLQHTEVVSAVVEAIRRLEATEALYALVKALCVLSRSLFVEEDTVVEIVDTLGEVGGPTAVKEAADRVAREARERKVAGSSLEVVGRVLLHRLSLCGDSALKTIRRLANCGPGELKPIAQQVYAAM